MKEIKLKLREKELRTRKKCCPTSYMYLRRNWIQLQNNLKKKILTISGIKEARHQMWKVSHHRKRVFSLVKAVGFSVEKYFEGEVEAKISGVK